MENIKSKALKYLEQDFKTNVSLIQVIRRNTAEIIECGESGVLLYDRVSKSHLISGEYNQTTVSWIEAIESSSLFFYTDPRFRKLIKERFGFKDELNCYQYVDLIGAKQNLDDCLMMIPATIADKEMIASQYQGISETELLEGIELGNLFLGFDEDHNLIGFVGSHLEGSIGLLKVFDKYRRNGYGASLVRFMINNFLAKVMIPFAQVELENTPSMKLQEKIGLERSQKAVGWLM